MSNDIKQVCARIMETASSLPPDTDRLTRYIFIEEICYAVLDSEYMEYPDGELEKHLRKFLEDMRRQLNINEADLA